MVLCVLSALGGAALFFYGLKIISEAAELFTKTDFSGIIEKRMKSPLGAFGSGIIVSACLQSSVATNMLAVGLVQSGSASFLSAAYAIMGANIGTTITTQLISFSVFFTLFLSVSMLIIGLLTDFCKSIEVKTFGKILIGTGIILTAVGIISREAEKLTSVPFIRSLFTSDKEWLLALNGFFLTSLAQSSSPVTGTLIAFSKSGAVSFRSSAFMILGANIGSSVPVAIMSLKKDDEARRTAFFNLWFNVFALLLFYPVLIFFGNEIERFFVARGTARAIADFNTAANLIPAVVALPLYPLIYKLNNGARKNNNREKSFNVKSRSNI